MPRTYTIYYRRGSRRLTFGVRTRTTGNLLEMGSREYFIGPTGKREQIVKDLDTLMKEVKKYARFDKSGTGNQWRTGKEMMPVLLAFT